MLHTLISQFIMFILLNQFTYEKCKCELLTANKLTSCIVQSSIFLNYYFFTLYLSSNFFLGLHLLWSLKGSLPWSTLVTPAATLALHWTIDNEVALLLLEIKPQLYSTLYPLLSALYIKTDGTLKVAGDSVQQPVLASTLQKIAKFGPDYLYVTMASTIATGKNIENS